MNIAVLGYGIEGQSTVRYFAKRGHRITVCDIDKKHESAAKTKTVNFKFGPHYLDDLRGFDLIFRSPGIPYLRKELDCVRSKLTSLTKYFLEKCPCPIIGVTGTKGKGTTASLIYEILKGAFGGRGGKRKIFLGGNIGAPPLDFLDELSPQDLVVLELSSFQLQDIDKSPHVAVVLGITPDHMDHHQDFEEYEKAKQNIARFQSGGDFAVLSMDNSCAASFSKYTKAKIMHFSVEEQVKEGAFIKAGSFVLKKGKTGMIFGERGKTKLIGPHNLQNVLAAAAAAGILGAPVEVISKVVREYPGLPHRLEFVREAAGVRYYNDSASTNPDTAIAALRSFSSPVILIAGGSDKNADFAPLGREIALRPAVKSVVVMGQTRPKIENAIENAFKNSSLKLPARQALLELIGADNYQEAFMVAKMMAEPGDTVLLSPACASFDMFKNYQERGGIFKDFVMDL